MNPEVGGFVKPSSLTKCFKCIEQERKYSYTHEADVEHDPGKRQHEDLLFVNLGTLTA